MWNVKRKMIQMTYLQTRDRFTDTENKLNSHQRGKGEG